MIQKLSIDNLPQKIAGSRHLICRLSFETRSLSVANAVSESVDAVTVFISRKRGQSAEQNLSRFRERFRDAVIVELDTSDPLQTADAIFEAILQAASKRSLEDTIIDVTAFRREELLMLLAVFRLIQIPSNTNCEIAYVTAASMSDWMSGQVTGYRSVIGYAGEIRPSRSTKLVVLMGFEYSRARSIIENYEPRFLVLGKGSKSESISEALHSLNEKFFQELRGQYDNVGKTFEFSARDPLAVAQEMEKAISLNSESNVIVAPLHTKLSTLGVGLYALKHREVQICYAPVAEYNEAAYSVPGRDIYLVPLKSLL